MAVTINGVAPTTAQQREFAAAMGLPVLLQTVVLGSNQQDIDFTGLDMDTDQMYEIRLMVSPSTTTNQETFCYYNGDLTAANYQNQFTLASTTTTTAGRASTAAAALGGAPSSTVHTIHAKIFISKTPAHTPILNSVNGYDNGGAVVTSYSHRWGNSVNVTSIKLRHTSTFGAGTVAKLYKV